MEVKIYYPSRNPFLKTSPVIYDYILHGFRQIGSVNIDSSIDKECRNFVEINNPNHLTVFYVEIDGKKHRVTYDWSDFHHYHNDIRKDGDFYFKIHFTEELYKCPRTYPIGQTVGSMDFIRELNSLESMVAKRNYKHNYKFDLLALYRTTNYDIRLKAVEILKKSNLNVVCGLKDFNVGKIRPPAPKEHKISSLTPYLDHLADLARSKYVLALPAVDNSRAWKHTEAMGMGVPLLALDLKSLLPGNYQDCYIKIKDDLSDLIGKINYYSEHEKERLEIGKRGKEYFEKWLSPKAMANNIIRTIKEREIQ